MGFCGGRDLCHQNFLTDSITLKPKVWAVILLVAISAIIYLGASSDAGRQLMEGLRWMRGGSWLLQLGCCCL